MLDVLARYVSQASAPKWNAQCRDRKVSMNGRYRLNTKRTELTAKGFDQTYSI